MRLSALHALTQYAIHNTTTVQLPITFLFHSRYKQLKTNIYNNSRCFHTTLASCGNGLNKQQRITLNNICIVFTSQCSREQCGGLDSSWIISVKMWQLTQRKTFFFCIRITFFFLNNIILLFYVTLFNVCLKLEPCKTLK